MAIFAIDHPPEFKGNAHFRGAQKLLEPVLQWLARTSHPPGALEPVLNGLLFALAVPLVTYLGRERAHAAVDLLKRSLDGVYQADKHH